MSKIMIAGAGSYLMALLEARSILKEILRAITVGETSIRDAGGHHASNKSQAARAKYILCPLHELRLMAEPSYTEDDWIDEDPPEAMPPTPPTQDELPCDDGEPMETQRHKWQMDILSDAMDVWLEQGGEGYTNANMFVYYQNMPARSLC